MKEFLKVMLLALIVLYVVSPIDLCPGPIDDTIVILLGVAAKTLENKKGGIEG